MTDRTMVKRDRLSSLMAGALVAALAWTAPLAAQEGYPELTRDEEMRLAMSAGPLAVSAEADVYVLGEQGFEKAIDGTNGFACLVLRSAVQRQTLAPHCLNPTAVETVLPAMLREGELQMQGLSGEAVDAELKRQWARGELPLPSGPAYAYMLSEGQRLGPNGAKFFPHFMLYVPYISNADIGGDPSQMQFPFVGPYENHPLSTVVVMMEEFVKPESVVLPRR
jgi:hypothetical protein